MNSLTSHYFKQAAASSNVSASFKESCLFLLSGSIILKQAVASSCNKYFSASFGECCLFLLSGSLLSSKQFKMVVLVNFMVEVST